MAFDPDQFLAETEHGFDPDTFLAETAPPGPVRQAFNAALPYIKKVGEYAVDPTAAVSDAVGAVADDPQKAYQHLGPWMPAAGGIIGTGLAGPGLGTAAGAGVGEIARQAAGILVNDPNTPRTAKEAATSAMGQTALAGAGEVGAIGKGVVPFVKSKALQAGRGVVDGVADAKPYVQRGVEYAADKLAPVGEGLKGMVARGVETMTGARASNVEKLIEQPSRLVSGIGQGGRLANELTAAEQTSQAGIPPAMRAKITMNEKGAATKIVSKLLEKKYTNPEAITPLEANAGIKAVDATFPQRTEKNKAIIQELSDLRSQLSDIVAKSDPNLAAAKSASHDYMVGATFRHPFRQTKYGQTSAVPFLSFLMSPTKWGDGRELVAQAAKLPLFSPAVYGTAVAAGSTALQAAGATLQSPTARQALISRYVVGKYGDGGR
jgi:hypothetical protein